MKTTNVSLFIALIIVSTFVSITLAQFGRGFGNMGGFGFGGRGFNRFGGMGMGMGRFGGPFGGGGFRRGFGNRLGFFG